MGIGWRRCFVWIIVVLFDTSGGRKGGPGRGGDSPGAEYVQQIDSIIVVVNSLKGRREQTLGLCLCLLVMGQAGRAAKV